MLTTAPAGAVLDDMLAPGGRPTSDEGGTSPEVQTPVLESEVVLGHSGHGQGLAGGAPSQPPDCCQTRRGVGGPHAPGCLAPERRTPHL